MMKDANAWIGADRFDQVSRGFRASIVDRVNGATFVANLPDDVDNLARDAIAWQNHGHAKAGETVSSSSSATKLASATRIFANGFDSRPDIAPPQPASAVRWMNIEQCYPRLRLTNSQCPATEWP